MRGTCRECRCTDRHACEGGCFWVLSDLCSRCVLNALAEAGQGLGPEDQRQLAGELLCLVESLDPMVGVVDGGATPGFQDEFDQPRLWRPGDP